MYMATKVGAHDILQIARNYVHFSRRYRSLTIYLCGECGMIVANLYIRQVLCATI